MSPPVEQPITDPDRSDYEFARLRLARLRVGGGASLRPVFQESTRVAAKTLGVERVSIWLFIGDKSAIRCFELYETKRDEHSEGAVLRREDYPDYFEALEHRRVIAADDARTHEVTRGFCASYLEPLDIRSMLDAPIFREGEVIGVVCHEAVGHKRHWTAEDTAFASSMADSIALQFEGAARHDAEAALEARESYVAEVHKMEALGRMAAGVAHDFRNILSVALGHARLIETDDSASPSVKEQASRIVSASERGVELTRELIAAGRDQEQEKPHAVRIPEVVEHFAEVMRQAAGRKVTVEITPSTTAGWALISPARLERVLLNLITNARDAMPSGGTVRLEVSEKRVPAGAGSPGVYVVLEVKDGGLGMDPETQRKIFEPFFTTKKSDQTAGLGLSIVYRIVDDSGGFVHVDSAPGKGTTVCIYLPRVASQG
jgi:signal transduction histidine kinase